MTRFEKWSVLSTSAATGATGIAYLWVKYGLEPTEPWAVINHPVQPWLLKSHILVAPLLVFAVGMIALRHIWRHYRSGMLWGRRSGILTGLALVPMVMTGYLIQGITHELWLSVAVWTHVGTSLAFVLGLAAHAVILARLLARGRFDPGDELDESERRESRAARPTGGARAIGGGRRKMRPAGAARRI